MFKITFYFLQCWCTCQENDFPSCMSIKVGRREYYRIWWTIKGYSWESAERQLCVTSLSYALFYARKKPVRLHYNSYHYSHSLFPILGKVKPITENCKDLSYSFITVESSWYIKSYWSSWTSDKGYESLLSNHAFMVALITVVESDLQIKKIILLINRMLFL